MASQYANVNTAIKLITPVEAGRVLANHENFRSLSKRRLNAYVRAMEADKWGLSILVFDTDGNLLDGQHRLRAVQESGKHIWFVCVYNWPKHERALLDNNQPRTRGQVAVAERGLHNANRAMALAVGIATMPDTERGRMVILNAEALELYDRFRATVERVDPYLVGPLKAALHGIAFGRAMIAFPARSDEIEEALSKLSRLDFAEPRMCGLRLYYSWAVTRGFVKGGAASRCQTYLRCARALKAYLDNEPIDKLYLPKGDPFPLPEHWDDKQL